MEPLWNISFWNYYYYYTVMQCDNCSEKFSFLHSLRKYTEHSCYLWRSCRGMGSVFKINFQAHYTRRQDLTLRLRSCIDSPFRSAISLLLQMQTVDNIKWSFKGPESEKKIFSEQDSSASWNGGHFALWGGRFNPYLSDTEHRQMQPLDDHGSRPRRLSCCYIWYYSTRYYPPSLLFSLSNFYILR